VTDHAEATEELVIRLIDAWAETVSAYLDRVGPFIRALGDLAADPQVRAALAARQFGEAVREFRPCHCLCGYSHREVKAACTMEAVASRHYDSPTVGAVDVPLCAPCAAAQGIEVPPA
jgi:hypothetical protein